MSNLMPGILSQMELVNDCKVIDKSYVQSGHYFILKLEGQKLIATITEDLVKSLHAKIENEQNHLVTVIYWVGNKEMINGCRLVDMTYDNILQIFVLYLEGQDEPVTMSKQLIKSLSDMIETKNSPNPAYPFYDPDGPNPGFYDPDGPNPGPSFEDDDSNIFGYFAQ